LTSCSCFAHPRFDTQDGLYDLAWSECHENQLATASGDGSVKLWDVMLNVRPSLYLSANFSLSDWLAFQFKDFPIRKWHEHQREVFSIDWSNTQKDLFCTSSWDGTIKIASSSSAVTAKSNAGRADARPIYSGHLIDLIPSRRSLLTLPASTQPSSPLPNLQSSLPVPQTVPSNSGTLGHLSLHLLPRLLQVVNLQTWRLHN
jgi:hypothetical protein